MRIRLSSWVGFPLRCLLRNALGFPLPSSSCLLLFLLLGLAWVSFLSFLLQLARTFLREAGAALHVAALFSLCFFLSLSLSLPGPAPLCLCLSLLLSFFLSFFLACAQTPVRRDINSGNRSGSCSENCGGRIAQVVGCHSEKGISYSENGSLKSESFRGWNFVAGRDRA